ncbi:hypothetical protein LR48_Vigan11g100000 [Vigna angularis]|uniref:Uncharacterized protein n=1 Tax=Phaseolus angularis TaxID=3914 RepID=A0A0L9VSZ9_PHAAN|nr:hypothetical protein LR48_Vigan11g100000 [Vigna angularis]
MVSDDVTGVANSTLISFLFAHETESQDLASPPSVTTLFFIMPNIIAHVHGFAPPSSFFPNMVPMEDLVRLCVTLIRYRLNARPNSDEFNMVSNGLAFGLVPKVPPGGNAQVSQGGSARAVVPKFHKATTSARPAIAR